MKQNFKQIPKKILKKKRTLINCEQKNYKFWKKQNKKNCETKCEKQIWKKFEKKNLKKNTKNNFEQNKTIKL